MSKKTYCFRPNAAALIVKGSKILAFSRRDCPESWQCPQGGIEISLGETPVEAMWREVKEETGLDNRSLYLLGEHPLWLGYEVIDNVENKILVQVQRWFVLRFEGNTQDINLQKTSSQEFEKWDWLDVESFLPKIVGFKKPSVAKICYWALENAYLRVSTK